jgi:hypothetical protein
MTNTPNKIMLRAASGPDNAGEQAGDISKLSELKTPSGLWFGDKRPPAEPAGNVPSVPEEKPAEKPGDSLPPMELSKRVRDVHAYTVPPERVPGLTTADKPLELVVRPRGSAAMTAPPVAIELRDPVGGEEVAFARVGHHVYTESQQTPGLSPAEIDADPADLLDGGHVPRGVTDPPDQMTLEGLVASRGDFTDGTEAKATDNRTSSEVSQAVGTMLDGYTLDLQARTTIPVAGNPGRLLSEAHRRSLGLTGPITPAEFAELVIGGPMGLNRVALVDGVTQREVGRLVRQHGSPEAANVHLPGLPVVAGTLDALQNRGCEAVAQITTPVGSPSHIVEVAFTRSGAIEQYREGQGPGQAFKLNNEYKDIL